MRTQIAKTEYLPAEYIPPTFSTRTPSPYSAGWRWGLLSRKIFFHFYFLIFARNLSEVWIENILNFTLVIITSNNFLFFSWLSSYSDSYPILFRISVVLTHYKFSLDILLVWFRYIFLDYNFGFCVFRLSFTRWILLASISTCFSIVDYTLCLFNSLSLLLIINKHLCLYEFVFAYFGYFKAFWRVFVCFRCSLSSWDKIMRQKA